jgi:hypothetical protein
MVSHLFIEDHVVEINVSSGRNVWANLQCNSILIFFRWMSTSQEGIRALWNGSQLFTHNGIQLEVPKSLLKSLPTFPVECYIKYVLCSV